MAEYRQQRENCPRDRGEPRRFDGRGRFGGEDAVKKVGVPAGAWVVLGVVLGLPVVLRWLGK